MKKLAALILGGTMLVPVTQAAFIPLQYSVAYSQNFNSLAGSGSSSVLPEGWALKETGVGANATYTAADGSAVTGNTISYGAPGSSDRALGSLRDGSTASSFGAEFKNVTGTDINRLGITYKGEEWRLGTAGRKDKLDFQYSLDATSLDTGTWIDVNFLDFLTPNTAVVGAKDGNVLGLNSRPVSGQIGFLNIPQGATFWVRWQDADATGADDGLAIDDFTITAVPEANTLVAGLGLVGILGWALGRDYLRGRRFAA